MADPKAEQSTTQALIEELRASREQGAATLAILAGLVTSLQPRPEQNVSEAMAARMEQIRGGGTPKLVTIIEHCTSPDTGSTFDVEVQDGRVVNLRNYQEPAGARIHKSQGGLYEGEIIVPGEVDRLGKPKINKQFATWLWKEYFQADLRRFVNKPCPKYLSETSVPAVKAAAAETAAPAKTG